MCNTNTNSRVHENEFKLVPPDGGWGYIVLLSLITFNLINVIPCTTFGLIYGNFLASIGDETSQTAMVTGIFFTVQMFSGVFSNILLRRFSFRQLGLTGACFYIVGTFSSIFMQTLPQMIICYSILEGLGAGLMLGVIFCSFNSYFHKRINLVMGIAQTCSILGVMVAPLIINFVMEHLGFRKTLILMTGITLLNIIGMGTLDPVERHMKKVLVVDDMEREAICRDSNTIYGKTTIMKTEPLLEKGGEKRRSLIDATIRSSLENLGRQSVSLGELNQNYVKEPLFDFSLIKSPKYLNINFGISFSFTADVTFDALIPSLLQPVGFTTTEIAYMMTVCFGCDLASRILFCIISIFFNFRNRPIFLAASLFMGIFRTVFILNMSYTWANIMLGLYGIARGFLQTILALVIAEEYKENFKSAFPLSMVLSGITSLTFAGLASLVKMTTQNDIMVVHLLTFANFLCVFCWTIELIYTRIKPKSSVL